MTQRFQLDSHKLQYHPQLVADFMDGKDIVPLNAEISITDACNHRCLFCNFNYLGHKRISLPEGRMPLLAEELGRAGVKTMTFGGAGEPLLHPDVFPAFRIGHSLGMDLAMSTNGVLLNQDQMEAMADMLTWVRFSMNGGSGESYAAVHNCRERDFDLAMANLHKTCSIRTARRSPLTVGVQCVLVDENYRDIGELARKARDAGADYFVVKHYYEREESGYRPGMTFRTEDFLDELAALASDMTSEAFSMVVRDVGRLERKRPYRQCLGLPFLVYVGENGLLYTCFSHHEDENTAIGNLLEHDFGTLWSSVGKTKAINHINRCYDKNLCQANCRHHQINLWLHQLKTPPPHVNFI